MSKLADGFFEDYRFLSNFWYAEVEYDGVVYPTNEHAFQAAKFDNLEYRKIIAAAKTPGIAKRLGQTRVYPLRENWEQGLSTQVMGELVAKKFANHSDLRDKLLTTGREILVETNHWGDDTWGNSTTSEGFGKNYLGVILMAVRESLKAIQ